MIQFDEHIFFKGVGENQPPRKPSIQVSELRCFPKKFVHGFQKKALFFCNEKDDNHLETDNDTGFNPMNIQQPGIWLVCERLQR